jgi:hypothetical protein
MGREPNSAVSGGTLTLLGKPDCHLCHVLAAVVTPVLAEYGATLVERDIRKDAGLRQRYELEIPVLLYGDAEVARHRVTPDELRSRLEALGFSRA